MGFFWNTKHVRPAGGSYLDDYRQDLGALTTAASIFDCFLSLFA